MRLFISHAHEDEEYKERLLTRLAPLTRSMKVDAWGTGHIELGREWLQDIKAAIESARCVFCRVGCRAARLGP